MADFDPDAFLQSTVPPSASSGKFDPDAFLKSTTIPTDQATFAERFAGEPEKSSRPVPHGAIANALEPITSYPETYAKLNKEAREQVSHGIEQISGPESSLWDRTKGAANIGLGSLGYATSPIAAGLKTVIGNPVENVTGLPTPYTEFATGLTIPGYGLRSIAGAKLPPVVPAVGKSAEAAATAEALANAARAREFGIELSKGQAAKDLEAIRFEDMASRGAHGKPAQEVAAPFFEQQFQNIQQGGKNVGEVLSRGHDIAEVPSEAATTINTEIGTAAERARAAQEAIERQAQAETTAQQGMAADRERILTEAIAEGHLPVENPREAGELVGHAVRQEAAAQRTNFRQLYNEAFGLEGQFHSSAFENIGTSVRNRLTNGENPVIIDDVTTPVASRAIRDLDNISNLRIQNRADASGIPNPENIVGVDLRGVDQARKRLVAYYQAARSSQNAADARAAGRLIDEFDNHVERAISNNLFSGDPRALDALQNARAAYSRYARAFRPQQSGDDVGAAMRRIVDRNATPEEIANMVVGSGRLGNAGLPVRLADRLENVLGRDSDAWSAIRQALWQRASHPGTPTGGIDPIRASRSITDFTGSSLAQRVFTSQELQAMRAHAQGISDLDATVAQLPEVTGAERARNAYQEIFGGNGIGGVQSTTFRRIIEGTATPEETSQAVFNAIGSGNPGNVSRMIGAIERIAGPDSQSMASIRQGVWQKLTQNAIGKDQPGQQKVAQAINEFLNGKGASIAKQLYTPEELSLMKRYADAIKLTVIPKYARTNSDTAVAALSALRKYSGMIMPLIGAGVDVATGGFGMIGGLAGHGVKKMLEKRLETAADTRLAQQMERHVDWRSSGGRIKTKPPISTRKESNYSPTRGTPDHHCGICSMYRKPNKCTEVAGFIVAKTGGCDWFQPATPERADGGSIVCGDGVPEHQSEAEWRGDPPQGIGEPEPLERASGGRVMPLHSVIRNLVDKEANKAHPSPSKAQQDSGIYRKGHLRIHGLDIVIENPRGSKRTGIGKDGTPWSVVMPAHYGAFRGTTAKDGDAVDCFVGPHIMSPHVFVIDQVEHETGKYDEPKCLIGFANKAGALRVYENSFSDGHGKERIGHVTEMTVSQLKEWLRDGDTTKPLKGSEHAEMPKVDRNHDVKVMSELSSDGSTMFLDRSLPRRVVIKGKVVDPAEPLLRHEMAEYRAMKEAVENYRKEHGKEPDDAERKEIYVHSHKHFGTPAEQEYLRTRGIDVISWNAWANGELARLEKKKAARSPPRPDVSVFPHGHGDLRESVD